MIKQINIKLIALLVFICMCIVETSSAQCDCNQTRLDNIMDNTDVKLVAIYGSNTAVTTINPGTTYYLRVQATDYMCELVGSGCNSVNAPVAYNVDLADGCTVFGNYVPPTIDRDVGTANNYTTYFTVQTFTGGNFLEHLYFRISTECTFKPGTCDRLVGGATQAFLP